MPTSKRPTFKKLGECFDAPFVKAARTIDEFIDKNENLYMNHTLKSQRVWLDTYDSVHILQDTGFVYSIGGAHSSSGADRWETIVHISEKSWCTAPILWDLVTIWGYA